ncbi:MAG TPA: hypothetical protein PLN21_18000 [Gemmatales bacterium]|nr:hypothetical protein [Gemmatales bacterium]
MTKPMRRMKCQVESLEDRQLPAVTLSLLDNGTTLSIHGDASPESLSITQNDDTDQLMVSWRTISDVPMGVLTPVSTFQSSSIKKIVVDLGGGDDVMNYRLDGGTMQWSKTINVDLGAGNDSAFFDFGGPLIVPLTNGNDPVSGSGSTQSADWPQPHPTDLLANLVVNASGGAGNDYIGAIFGNVKKGLTLLETGNGGDDFLSSSVAGTMGAASPILIDQDGGAGNDQLWTDLGTKGIDASSKVTVNQRGGAGSDQLTVNANLPLLGSLGISQSGGAGDDTIATRALMDWSSTGSLTARINGDAGNDSMGLRLKRDDIPPEVNLLVALKKMRITGFVNGGVGHNVSWITPNVQTFLTQVKQRSWDMWEVRTTG